MQAERHPIRRRFSGALIGALVGVVVVMLFVLLVQLSETTAAIKGCTDPSGACYRDGQKRTTQAVGNIAVNNILAIVCALQVSDGTPLRAALEQVTACVQANQPRAK